MSLTRRNFLQRTAIGGAVVASGVTLGSGCGNDVIAAPIVDAEVEDADVLNQKTYGTVALSLNLISDLVPVGGAVTVRVAEPKTPATLRGYTLPDPPHLLVVHRGQIGEPDEWIAVDSSCPHAGCPLGYSASADRILCPCHSSQFRAVPDPTSLTSCVGEVLHLPARQGPTPYQVGLDPDDPSILRVDLRVVNSCGTVRLPAIVGGKLTLMVAQYPMLSSVGGSIIGRPLGANNAIAVVRVAATSDASAFAALSAVCTHLGCTVSYSDGSAPTSCGAVPAGGGFYCSCHCSQFALDGTVRVGPASRALTRYAIAFDGTTLVITLA
jgi:Rieske Fe-S protein